jgi:recombination protein RecT
MSTAQIVPKADQLGTMLTMLDKLKPQMKHALPRHLTADRMMRIVVTTLRRTEKLLLCDPISLCGAVIQACQLGLEPDGFLGEFYLTPRRLHGEWNVVGIPGYRGLMKLARQSGDLDWIVAHVAYQGDEIHYEYGAVPQLVHKPGPGPHKDELITHAYAVSRLRTGSSLFWAMRRVDIDSVRDRWAAARDEGPWITHYPEMAMKTPVRRLCKFLPQSTSLGRAISLDETAEAGIPQGLEALVDTHALGLGKAHTRQSTLDRLGEALEERAKKQGNGPAAAAAPPVSEGAAEDFASAAGSPPPAAEALKRVLDAEAAAPAPPPPVSPPAPRAPRAPRRPKFPRAVEVPATPPPAPPAVPESPASDAPTEAQLFDYLGGATSPAELTDRAEKLYATDWFVAYPPEQKKFIREYVAVCSRRLSS